MRISVTPGMRMGGFVVIGRSQTKPTNRKGFAWECLCDCGKRFIRMSGDMARTVSCGCRRAHHLSQGNPTHGKSKLRAYTCWAEMKRRCENRDHPTYARYGAVGITVCDRWKSFELFFEDMGECPPRWSLDRIDGALGYSPANCRWASIEMQQNNRRSNVRITLNGITKTIAQWARENGIRPRTAAQRIRAGWPNEIAVSRESNKGMRLCA